MDEEQIKALFAQALGPVMDRLSTLGTTVEALQKTTPAPAPAKDPAPAKEAAALSPEANAQLLEFKRNAEAQSAQIKKLTEANEAANKAKDEAERQTAVNAALSEFTFHSPEARLNAAQQISQHIQRNETGQLVAGDNLTVDAFAKDFLPTKHAYLLAPVGGGGAGVIPGSASYTGHKAVDLNDIKAGMSAETEQAVYAAMRNAVNQQQGR